MIWQDEVIRLLTKAAFPILAISVTIDAALVLVLDIKIPSVIAVMNMAIVAILTLAIWYSYTHPQQIQSSKTERSENTAKLVDAAKRDGLLFSSQMRRMTECFVAFVRAGKSSRVDFLHTLPVDLRWQRRSS